MGKSGRPPSRKVALFPRSIATAPVHLLRTNANSLLSGCPALRDPSPTVPHSPQALPVPSQRTRPPPAPASFCFQSPQSPHPPCSLSLLSVSPQTGQNLLRPLITSVLVAVSVGQGEWWAVMKPTFSLKASFYGAHVGSFIHSLLQQETWAPGSSVWTLALPWPGCPAQREVGADR